METAVVPECVEGEPEAERSSVERSDLSSVRPLSERGVERFDPLGTAPPDLRDRYEKYAQKAACGSLAVVVRLKRLECRCWQQSEIRRCEIVGRALWARFQLKTAAIGRACLAS